MTRLKVIAFWKPYKYDFIKTCLIEQKSYNSILYKLDMISLHLKQLREVKGLTLREVGERTGKNHSHISMIENGRMEPEDATVLDLLVKGFDIPYSEARDLLAQWKVEDAMKGASSPAKVLKQVMKGVVVKGNNNSINQIAK